MRSIDNRQWCFNNWKSQRGRQFLLVAHGSRISISMNTTKCCIISSFSTSIAYTSIDFVNVCLPCLAWPALTLFVPVCWSSQVKQNIKCSNKCRVGCYILARWQQWLSTTYITSGRGVYLECIEAAQRREQREKQKKRKKKNRKRRRMVKSILTQYLVEYFYFPFYFSVSYSLASLVMAAWDEFNYHLLWIFKTHSIGRPNDIGTRIINAKQRIKKKICEMPSVRLWHFYGRLHLRKQWMYKRNEGGHLKWTCQYLMPASI